MRPVDCVAAAHRRDLGAPTSVIKRVSTAPAKTAPPSPAPRLFSPICPAWGARVVPCKLVPPGSRWPLVFWHSACGAGRLPNLRVVASVALSDASGACSPEAGCSQVLDALGFDKTGKPYVLSATDLANLSCAADCGLDGAGSLMPDPASIPTGGAGRPLAYPSTLAVDTQTSRLFVGDAYGDRLTIVDLDLSGAGGAHFRGAPVAFSWILTCRESLRGGQQGTTAIRIARRTAAGQFAYVAAADGSIRVVDLDREVECETNPDPRYLQQHAGDTARVLPDRRAEREQSASLELFPQPPHASQSLGDWTGYRAAGGGLGQDIGFVHLDLPSCDTRDPTLCPFAPDADPTIWRPTVAAQWVGDYAWILGGRLADCSSARRFLSAAIVPRLLSRARSAASCRSAQHADAGPAEPELINLPAIPRPSLCDPSIAFDECSPACVWSRRSGRSDKTDRRHRDPSGR